MSFRTFAKWWMWFVSVCCAALGLAGLVALALMDWRIPAGVCGVMLFLWLTFACDEELSS